MANVPKKNLVAFVLDNTEVDSASGFYRNLNLKNYLYKTYDPLDTYDIEAIFRALQIILEKVKIIRKFCKKEKIKFALAKSTLLSEQELGILENKKDILEAYSAIVSIDEATKKKTEETYSKDMGWLEKTQKLKNTWQAPHIQEHTTNDESFNITNHTTLCQNKTY